MEGAQEGLKIEHLNLGNIVNTIDYHSFYDVAKVGELSNFTNSTIELNLILLKHRGQLFFPSFLLMTDRDNLSTLILVCALFHSKSCPKKLTIWEGGLAQW